MKKQYMLTGIICCVLGLLSCYYWTEIDFLLLLGKYDSGFDIKTVLADRYQLSKEDKLALAAFEGDSEKVARLLEQNPDNKYLLLQWIGSGINDMDTLDYLPACQKLIEQEPDNGYYDVVRAVLYMRAKQPGKAIDALRAAAAKPGYYYPELLQLLGGKYPVSNNGLIKYLFRHDLNMVNSLYYSISQPFNQLHLNVQANRELLELVCSLLEARELNKLHNVSSRWSVYSMASSQLCQYLEGEPEAQVVYRTISKENKLLCNLWLKTDILTRECGQKHMRLVSYALSLLFIAAVLAVPVIIMLLYNLIWRDNYTRLSLSQYVVLVAMIVVFWLVFYCVYDYNEWCGGITKTDNVFYANVIFWPIISLWLLAAISHWLRWSNMFFRLLTKCTASPVVQPLLIMIAGGCLTSIMARVTDVWIYGQYDFELQVMSIFAIAYLAAVPACCRRNGGVEIKLRHALLQLLPLRYFQRQYISQLRGLYLICFVVTWVLVIICAGKWRVVTEYYGNLTEDHYNDAMQKFQAIPDIDAAFKQMVMDRISRSMFCVYFEDLLLLNTEELDEVLQVMSDKVKLEGCILGMYYKATPAQQEVLLKYGRDSELLQNELLLQRAISGDVNAKYELDTLVSQSFIGYDQSMLRSSVSLTEAEQVDDAVDTDVTPQRYYEICIACYRLNSEEENIQWINTIYSDPHGIGGFCDAYQVSIKRLPPERLNEIVEKIITLDICDKLDGGAVKILAELPTSSSSFIKWRLQKAVEFDGKYVPEESGIAGGRSGDFWGPIVCLPARQINLNVDTLNYKYVSFIDESMIPLLLKMLSCNSDQYRVWAVRQLNGLGYAWPAELIDTMMQDEHKQVRAGMVQVASPEQLQRLVADEDVNVRLAAKYRMGAVK